MTTPDPDPREARQAAVAALLKVADLVRTAAFDLEHGHTAESRETVREAGGLLRKVATVNQWLMDTAKALA